MPLPKPDPSTAQPPLPLNKSATSLSPKSLSSKNQIATIAQRFFAKRAPRADAIQLNLRNVYIFFSRGGLLFALLLLITFVTGINYGNNLVLGLCFYLVSVWVISFHLTFAHVFGLTIRLLNAPLVQAGAIAWVTLELVNDKAQPSRQLHLTFDHDLQAATSMPPEAPATASDGLADSAQSNSSQAPSSIWQQQNVPPSVYLTHLTGRQQLPLPVRTYGRGRLLLPRLIVSTVYPLGIMRAWSYLYFASPVWVYPKPLAFDLQAAHVVSSDDEQNFSAHKASGQNDFESLDEYVAGESLARVSWAHLARGQGMLTKQFADAVGREQLLEYAAMPARLHEEKLAQLTYAVLQLGEAGGAFQMNLPDDKGTVGQGSAFIEACLMRLAKCP